MGHQSPTIQKSKTFSVIGESIFFIDFSTGFDILSSELFPCGGLKMNLTFGVLPPPGLEWQMGKTAASISFVKDAEGYMARSSNAQEIERLKEVVQDIKKGIMVLGEKMTVEEFLATPA